MFPTHLLVKGIPFLAFFPVFFHPTIDEAGTVGRSVRSLNRRLVNAQENISISGTGMKAEKLCDLLNERLLKMRK